MYKAIHSFLSVSIISHLFCQSEFINLKFFDVKITVKVTANSKRPRIEKKEDASYHIYVRAAATEGKANKEVIESFAEYFDVPKSKIEIMKGETSKNKILEIS